MIRGCRFVRLTGAEEEGDAPVVVEAVVTEAMVSLCSTNGYVLTVSKLQSDSESDSETGAAGELIDNWSRNRLPFSRSAR